ADALEPGELLLREHAVRIRLGEEPGAVALADEVRVGDELVLLVKRDPDERDEVGQNALSRAADPRAVERLVRLPEPLRRPAEGRTLDRLRELLHLAEREPLRLPARIQDLEC